MTAEYYFSGVQIDEAVVLDSEYLKFLEDMFTVLIQVLIIGAAWSLVLWKCSLGVNADGNLSFILQNVCKQWRKNLFLKPLHANTHAVTVQYKLEAPLC